MKTSKARKTDANGAVVIRSADGEICFQLRPIRAGLLVQRDRRQRDGRARLFQSVVFSSVDGFVRWCECDSVRFEYPIIFSTVRREADALLQKHCNAASKGSEHERR